MLVFVTALMAYPGSYSDAQLEQCVTGDCPNAHSAAPNPGNALTATGKTDGGTYVPGETINIANAGGGQYALYASAGGVKITRSDDAPTTVTAPQTGTLTLLGIRAAGRNTCTYQKITLTAAVGGGGGVTPPPADGDGDTVTPPPGGGVGSTYPPPPPLGGAGEVGAGETPWNQYESDDGQFGLTWTPAGTTMTVTATARPRPGAVNPPGWIGFALSDNSELINDAGATLMVVAYRPDTLAPPIGRRLADGRKLQLPPPPGGGSSIQAYLMTGETLAQIQEVDANTLATCGFNIASTSVTLQGRDVVMTFTLTIGQESDPTCTIGGAVVPSFTTTAGSVSRALIAKGESQTFTQDVGSSRYEYDVARDVLGDSKSAGGGGAAGPAAAGAIILLVAAFGYYKYKQKKEEIPPPPDGWQQDMAKTPQQYGGMPAPIQPTQPPSGGGGWVQTVDPTSGQMYYANPQTGQTSWTRPPDFV